MELICHSAEGNKYTRYEQRSRSLFQLRCIDGHHTSCGNCVGYCRYSGHEGFLTRQQRKEHNCIGKKCDYYLQKPKKIKGDML